MSEGDVRVQDLMTAEVVTASPDETAGDARVRMVEHRISALPVIDDQGTLVGIVTSTDLLRHNDETSSLPEIMSPDVYVLPPDTDVHVAARLMRNHGIHHIVVLENSDVVGMLATHDLLQIIERPGDGEPPTENMDQRQRLEEILGHLTRRTSGVERARTETAAADSQEQALARQNDEVLDALASEGRAQIDIIGRALERLDTGAYGKCEDCGGQIAEARLKALPYAVHCIDCARKRQG